MEEKTPLQKVLDIFIEYYGEDKVDLQENFIYVYFPRVTVTNEYDKSIDITELYVRVIVDNDGRLAGTFTLNRSEYPVNQWCDNYMHSHISNIPKSNLHSFCTPCLGTGPIRDTCSYLNRGFDANIWELFVLELDKYVHTESISGGPYHRLENIGSPKTEDEIIKIDLDDPTIPSYMLRGIEMIFERFLHHVINKRPFSFGFVGHYIIADSPYNIVVKLSNLFIDWYNTLPLSEQGTTKEIMFRHGTLARYIADGRNIIRRGYKYFNYDETIKYVGTQLWTFKGNIVRLNIIDLSETNLEPNGNYSTLLHPTVVGYLVNRILGTINYKYGHRIFEPGKEAIYI